MSNFKRSMLTRGLAIFPSLIVAVLYGQNGADDLIVFYQIKLTNSTEHLYCSGDPRHHCESVGTLLYRLGSNCCSRLVRNTVCLLVSRHWNLRCILVVSALLGKKTLRAIRFAS